MKLSSLMWLVAGSLSLIYGGGCIYSHRAPAVVYTPAPAPPTTVPAPPAVVVAPTSDRPVARVYPGPSSASPEALPPTAAPPSVSSTDVAVADSVRQLLKGNSDLAPVSHNVEATVDHGVVTLRGTVPAEHVKDEIAERVAKLPGVDHVSNQLAVEVR